MDETALYLPGGKIEDGESLEQALVREVREELGLDLIDLLPAFTVTAVAHGLPDERTLTMHCFTAQHAGDPQPAREIAELAWLGALDFERAAPAVQEVLRRIATE